MTKIPALFAIITVATTITGCATLKPARDHYASVKAFAADLPEIDRNRMYPTLINGEKYVGTHVWQRGDCPSYATIRLSDHKIRHFRFCHKSQAPEEFTPDVRPWPDTEEAEFIMEQTVENLFADRRYFIKLQPWNGFRILAYRADFKYDDKGCERMRGYAYDMDGKKQKGLVAFYETRLCKED